MQEYVGAGVLLLRRSTPSDLGSYASSRHSRRRSYYCGTDCGNAELCRGEWGNEVELLRSRVTVGGVLVSKNGRLSWVTGAQKIGKNLLKSSTFMPTPETHAAASISVNDTKIARNEC
ncbi:hypothetical protein C8J57DRAFT_1228113 [Mycena rebaudengoi]|nr:hypothetical protein C8J57DRAFT_1228113 [Mycena rebaudengoi]